MLQEDLDTIIGILESAMPDESVAMPGAVCSAGELLAALIDARRYRWLRENGHIIPFGRGNFVDSKVDAEMAKPHLECQF